MKAILSLLAVALVLGLGTANGQQFSSTTGVPCTACHPQNYTMLGGPYISDINRPGGDVLKAWNNAGSQNVLPVPPSTYSQGLPGG